MLQPTPALREHAPHRRLVVALDVGDGAAALRMVDALGPELTWVKVGLELFTAAGPDVVRALRAMGLRVFLDLKLHDIPHTVERAAAAAAALGAQLCTVHALGGAGVKAAVRGAAPPAPPPTADHQPGTMGILAVTVLTSHAEGELQALVGSPWDTAQLTGHLAQHAVAQGACGLVCSPLEVSTLRRAVGPAPLLVVPGVRPAGSAHDDQQRTATAADTLRAGADLLVVGRPITRSAQPRDALRRVLDEMGTAV